MKNWLRLKGLIAFTVIVALLVVLGFFVASPVARMLLESNLTSMNGAKVDVEDVDITWSPFGMTVKNIEVTDPGSPMVNSLQIAEAGFTMVFSDLLLKKVTIETMTLSGVQINTARSYSGAIETHTASNDETAEATPADVTTDAAEESSVSLPAVDDVIKNANLQTDAVVSKVEADIDAANQRMDQMKTDLGDKTRWDNYEQRYKAIRAGFKGNSKAKLKALKDAKKLSKDLKAEQKKISTASKTLKQDAALIKNGIADVKTAIKQDKNNLKTQYTGGAATSNVVGLVFGSKAAEYTALVKQWYGRIKPYIESDDEAVVETHERSSGEYIRFTEFHPKPDFYLKKAHIDAQLPAGSYEGDLINVSSDQAMTGKPAILKLNGIKQSDREKETIYAEYNAINPDNVFTRADYFIRNYKLSQFEISGDSSMPVSIDKADMTLKVNAVIKAGVINAKASSDFKRTSFVTGSGGSSLKGMINDSLKNIHEFDVRADVKGEIKSLKFDVSSNIDNQVGDAINLALKKQADKFADDLDAKLQAKYADKLAKLNSAQDSIDTFKASLNAKQADLKNRLKRLK